MLAGVAEVPDAAVAVVVPDVGEEDRRARDQLEQLHGERAVHVGLGRAHVRRLRAVPVVRVVEERLRDVGRREVARQLGLALDAGEVEVQVVDQVAHGEVHAELALEQLRREELAVVVDGPAVLLEPQPPLLRLGGIRLLRSPHELELVDLLDVDAEAGEPGVRARRGRVHPHRASADASEGHPAKPADCARRLRSAPRGGRARRRLRCLPTRACIAAPPGRARRPPRASQRDPAARDRGST